MQELAELQTAPLPQPVPAARLVQVVGVKPALGWQVWQALLGFAVPGAYTVPPMKHPEPQLPALHTLPVSQLVPSTAFVNAVVLVLGWQIWHAFVEGEAPSA
jgi:hypothetical protein